MELTRIRRTDANQQDIIDALREAGAGVYSAHAVGQGFPDLIVGFRGMTYLLEVKNEGGKLTRHQVGWHDMWAGHAAVVWCVEDALREIGAIE